MAELRLRQHSIPESEKFEILCRMNYMSRLRKLILTYKEIKKLTCEYYKPCTK